MNLHNKIQQNQLWKKGVLSLSLAALLTGLSGAGAKAQSDDETYSDRVREEINTQDRPAAQEQNDGPVRLARFRYLKGGVSYRADSRDAWEDAGVNTPLREGAQISVSDDDSRAELQFDDGSILRLGRGALVTLTNLYSDAEGAFTQVKLQDGTATLRPKHERSVYQVDTPFFTVKAAGPADFRVNAGEDVEVGVHSGSAVVESSRGEKRLAEGDFLRLSNPEDELVVRDEPRPDLWDRWNSDRDRVLAEGDAVVKRHLPSNIAIVAGDLNGYGDWRDDPDYGTIWVPRVTSVEWRPYYDGRWTWVAPFGWTWVSNEAWGWAPYHYGTWVHRGFGWAWVPGPVTQYWSPGVVHFCENSGGVAWVPLAPREVVYPSRVAIGARFSNWSLFFSIGQAGVYYYDNNVFRPRPWNSGYINQQVNVINTTTIVNNYGSYGGRDRARSSFDFVNRNTTLAEAHYVPINARLAEGASAARLNEFGQGRYRTMGRAENSIFGQGRAVGAPGAGGRPASGPASLRPASGGRFAPEARSIPTSRAMERSTFSVPSPSRDRAVPLPTTANRLRNWGAYPGTRGLETNPASTRTRTGDSTLPFPRGRDFSTGRSTGTSASDPQTRRRTPAAPAGGETANPASDRNRIRTSPRSADGTETHGTPGFPLGNRSSAADTARRAREALGGRLNTDRVRTTPESSGTSRTFPRSERGTGQDRTYTPTSERSGDRTSRPAYGRGMERGTDRAASGDSTDTRTDRRARAPYGGASSSDSTTRRYPSSDSTGMPSRRDRSGDYSGTRTRETPGGGDYSGGRGTRSYDPSSSPRVDRRSSDTGGGRSAERSGRTSNPPPSRDRGSDSRTDSSSTGGTRDRRRP